MKKTKLGEFEELVLLTVVVLQEDAYGVRIKGELEERINEKLSVGSIQSALKRMEEKGFLTSKFGEATKKRGGKRKRIYTATPYAFRVLSELKDVRTRLWESLPKFAHDLKIS
ncbi:PadR family transcriptional regulator [Fulvivirga sp. M361]|uniref:PadR family transcriptional regulator n=1 Tax=Fulvivirga sp. M361 TaxID=2594266 RepID=UPI001179A4AF|nr:helix-turn-helix transcriptional regulator [Fulvivirga sp. M361]TRX52059.1 PadR family transcriptional regulator [Fulvivirga sp. M361]